MTTGALWRLPGEQTGLGLEDVCRGTSAQATATVQGVRVAQTWGERGVVGGGDEK